MKFVFVFVHAKYALNKFFVSKGKIFNCFFFFCLICKCLKRIFKIFTFVFIQLIKIFFAFRRLPECSLKFHGDMFPLFATVVVDTGGQFTAGVVDTGGNSVKSSNEVKQST